MENLKNIMIEWEFISYFIGYLRKFVNFHWKDIYESSWISIEYAYELRNYGSDLFGSIGKYNLQARPFISYKSMKSHHLWNYNPIYSNL